MRVHADVREYMNHLADVEDDDGDDIVAGVDDIVDDIVDDDIVVDDDEDDINFHNRRKIIDRNKCIYALISNITLINRCLSISPVKLNLMLKYMDINVGILRTRFDTSRLNVLYEHNIDSKTLLSMAYQSRDYDTMLFIIQRMHYDDICNVINNNRYTGLIELLFIDKLCRYNESYVALAYSNELMILASTFHNASIIMECYHIIKYLTQTAGKKYLDDKQSHYIKKHLPYNDVMLLYSDLLEYHFRPRGLFTKSAIN
jgi:hypothetical protein